MTNDVICAIATAPGSGGVGIIRVSGATALTVCRTVIDCQQWPPTPRYVTRCRFIDADGTTLDDGMCVYFSAPKSFTGEHVVELHAHGSMVTLQALCERLCAAGARLARAGEFSERAFLAGKIDLVQAEAVADLINAHSLRAAKAAARSLQGEFSASVRALADEIMRLRVSVEAAIDFVDEDIDFIADGDVLRGVTAIAATIQHTLSQARAGAKLAQGTQVVLAGRPNVGKSSILNRLCGNERAIVTDTPGTTRDVLRETVVIDGMRLTISDTAGLRENADAVEQEGIRRACAAADDADIVVIVCDGAEQPCVDAATQALLTRVGERALVVVNKCDVLSERPLDVPSSALLVSARTGAGFATLQATLSERAGGAMVEDDVPLARLRHITALAAAEQHVAAAAAGLANGALLELTAEELRLAHNKLGEIIGTIYADDVLGEIFAGFCIGK